MFADMLIYSDLFEPIQGWVFLLECTECIVYLFCMVHGTVLNNKMEKNLESICKVQTSTKHHFQKFRIFCIQNMIWNFPKIELILHLAPAYIKQRSFHCF